MAISAVSICNQSLLLLGKNTIQSFDENTAEAQACSAFYETARDHVLRDIKPPFIIKRIDVVNTTPPSGPYQFAYQMPTDTLLVMGVGNQNDQIDSLTPTIWVIEQNLILTSWTISFVRYLAVVEGVEQLMDASFVKILVAYLAAEMSYTLTESSGKLAAMMQLYEQRRMEAMTIYGQGQSTQPTYNTQLLINR